MWKHEAKNSVLCIRTRRAGLFMLLAVVGDRTGSRKWWQIHDCPLVFQFYQHLNGWKLFICTAPEFIMPPSYLFSPSLSLKKKKKSCSILPAEFCRTELGSCVQGTFLSLCRMLRSSAPLLLLSHPSLLPAEGKTSHFVTFWWQNKLLKNLEPYVGQLLGASPARGWSSLCVISE